MIGLYTQNPNTQNELRQLLQDAALEIYQPGHPYHLVIWLSDEKPPKGVTTLLPKDLPLPMTPAEWQLFVQKHSSSALNYKNNFFMIETDKRLLTNLKTKKQIALTEKENEMIAFLIKAPQHTATRDTLLQAVWQYNPETETHTIESHLYALKQKVGADFENLLCYQNGQVVLC